MDEENKVPETPSEPAAPVAPEPEPTPPAPEPGNQAVDKEPPPAVPAVAPKLDMKKTYRLIRGAQQDLWIQDGNKFVGGKYVGKYVPEV